MMIQMAALGKMPAYPKGVSTEVVGVEDVAEAFLLAGERGRVGERYIVSESYMSMRELLETAAQRSAPNRRGWVFHGRCFTHSVESSLSQAGCYGASLPMNAWTTGG